MSETILIRCEHCGGEGRIYSRMDRDGLERDLGACPVCDGSCTEEVEAEPITLEDLDQ